MSALWLCFRLPRLPLESFAQPVAAPCAVYERHGSRKSIRCANPAAEALGISTGQALSAATALAPQLQSFERNPRAERAALQGLAATAYHFSGQVTVHNTAPAPQAHALWLEISGSAHLFGGEEQLAQQLHRKISALGYSACTASAATLEAAYLLAGHEGAESAAPRRALRDLPVQSLPVAAEITAALHGSGINSVGALLEIPADALARRFGADFTAYLGRLTGSQPDPRNFYRPPARFRRRFELTGAAETTEALRFPIKRLLSEFVTYLIARDTGVQAFLFELGHEEREPTRVVLGLASPSRDLNHLQVVMSARLERLSVPSPVEDITLIAEQFAAPRVRQFDLFQERSVDEIEWQSVLDRLCARLGPEAITGLGLCSDPRPEKSWSRVPTGTVAPIEPVAERPLWLLPEPRKLPGMPACVRGPERIEGGWWEGLDEQRDYYVAETAEFAQLWVFRERGTDRWFLHGLWA